MKMKLVLLFVLLTFCNINVIGNIEQSSMDSLKKEVISLKQCMEELDSIQASQKEQINTQKEQIYYQKEQINNQVGMLDTAFDGVSTEISSASYIISIFGIILTIVSIGLGIYVSRIVKNVKAMKDDSQLLLQENILIKHELEALSEKITKDSRGLYKLVRNEESNHMIERLISVPEDITNLFMNLASRDLVPEHFPKLKEAFLQVKDNPKKSYSYLILLFQHFSGLSILDKEVKPEFIKGLAHSFACAFKNDAVKSATDYFNALVEFELVKSKAEINTYVINLCKSQYSQSEEVYFAINNTMKSRELKFILYDSVEKVDGTLCFRKIFGKLLLEYGYENLAPNESATIDDIKKIITL